MWISDYVDMNPFDWVQITNKEQCEHLKYLLSKKIRENDKRTKRNSTKMPYSSDRVILTNGKT